ncbi:unnamed protein product [Heterobilharzia americana]|nr:unnamed protein product [Heterobilharzia americana]
MNKSSSSHIPLPIQSFLFSQTCSFLQKPAARDGVCTTFEKVVVQNILHGRSIVLCEAIQSISRWRFVKAALPHVLHCGAVMLREKLRDKSVTDQQQQKHGTSNSSELLDDRTQLNFSQTETKLLYTLHWILLDAASECEDAEIEVSNHPASKVKSPTDRYVHDLASLQLFIYLYAPIIDRLKPTDFDTLKLEAGLHLWIPLMEHCQPNRGTLSFPVRIFPHGSNPFSRSAVVDIDESESPKTGSILSDINKRKSFSEGTAGEISSNVYVGNVSDKSSEIDCKLPSAVKPLEVLVDSATIPHVEVNSDGSESSGLYSNQNLGCYAANSTQQTLTLQPPKATPECMDDEEEVSEKSASENTRTAPTTNTTKTTSPSADAQKPEQVHVAPGYESIQKFLNSLTDPYKQLSERLKYSTIDNEYIQPAFGSNCMLATHCDLAVIRCLFCPEWCESGIYWSLCYLFNRLLQIRSEWLKTKLNSRNLFKLHRSNLPSGRLFKWAPGLWPPVSSNQARISQITGTWHVLNPFHCNSSEQSSQECREDKRTGDFNQQKYATHHEQTCEPQMYSTSGNFQPSAGSAGTHPFPKYSSKPSHFDESFSLKGISSMVGSSASLLNVDKSENNMMISDCSREKNPKDEQQQQHFSTSLMQAEISLGDPTFTLALPIASFGGQQHQQNQQRQQPTWRGSKRSRIADIKERFTRASKFKSGDVNMKFQPPSAIEAPECDQSPTSTTEGQIFNVQNKRSIPTGGEKLHLSPNSSTNERPFQGFDTANDDSESNKFGQNASPNSPSVHTGLKLGLPQNTPSIAVASKSSDNNETNSVDDHIFTEVLPRCMTDSDITYHSLEKVDEVSGAAYYITPSGQLDYSILLRSFYWCSTVHTSSRVCFHIVRCLSVLFDLGIFDIKSNSCSSKNVSFEKPAQLRRFRKKNHYERKNFSKALKTPILNKLVVRENRNNSSLSSRGAYENLTLPSSNRLRPRDSSGGVLFTNLSSSRAFVGICSESYGSETGDDADTDAGTKKKLSSRTDNESLMSEDNFMIPCNTKNSSPLGSPESSLELDRDLSSTPRRIGSPSNIEVKLRNNDRFLDEKLASKSAHTSRSRSHFRQSVYCDTSNQLVRMNYTLAVEMLIRIIRATGCRHGHSSSPNFTNHHYHQQQQQLHFSDYSQQQDHLDPSVYFRSLIYDCLIYLHELNAYLFKRVILRIVSSSTVADLIEMLHSLTGFCLDPVTRHSERSNYDRKSYLTYGNSFGQTEAGQDIRGAEGLIISHLFGPFVRRLVRCRRELSSQENVSLFSDIRQLFTYIREIHGSTFRKNMLVALLCPIQRVCEVSLPRASAPLPRMSVRNSMWLIPRQDKRRSTFNLFIDPLAETESLSSGHRDSGWHGLLSRPSTPGQSIRIHSNGSSSTLPPSFENDHSSRSKSDGPAIDQSAVQTTTEHRWVNLSALREGLLDFAFLLDCCEPGSIPEPQLVAALFDLDAPVLARACLLLECAFLVHRCNRDEWAGWMKFNLPSSFRSSAGYVSNSNLLQPNDNNNGSNQPVDISEIKRSAGYLFYAWVKEFFTGITNMRRSKQLRSC